MLLVSPVSPSIALECLQAETPAGVCRCPQWPHTRWWRRARSAARGNPAQATQQPNHENQSINTAAV
jgi:hypothetical protein